MKPKKIKSFKYEQQIWRLLIAEPDKLIIETRDIDTKEVFFNCININTGKKLFTKFQLNEKFWVGIEAIYKNVILFHKFPKPDMPGHKEIIAVDLNSQNILWQSNQYVFLLVYDDKIYTFREEFEGRTYFTLDYKTGNLIEELGDQYENVNEIRRKADEEKDYGDYLFPEKFDLNLKPDVELTRVLRNQISNLDIIGDVEYTVSEKLLLMNFHSRISDNNLENKFTAIDINTEKVVLSDVLNSDLKAFVPDSFFIYKNVLILLLDKTKILLYRIE